jgi:hypothetical protein
MQPVLNNVGKKLRVYRLNLIMLTGSTRNHPTSSFAVHLISQHSLGITSICTPIIKEEVSYYSVQFKTVVMFQLYSTDNNYQ